MTRRRSLSQSHPLFFEHTTTNTRYFTAQYQHLFSSNLLNVLRFAANQTARTDDLRPTIEIPQGAVFFIDRSALRRDRHHQRLDGRFDCDYARRLHAGRLPGLRHADLEQGLARHQVGLRPAELPLRRVLVLALRRDVPLPEREEFLTLQRSGTAQADRFTGNLPGTDTFREMRQRYAAFFVQDDWRASRPSQPAVRPALRLRDRPERVERQSRRAARPQRPEHEAGRRSRRARRCSRTRRRRASRRGWASPGTRAATRRSTVKGGYGLFYQPLTTSFYRGTTFRIYPYFAGVDIRRSAGVRAGHDRGARAGVSSLHRSEALRVHLLRREAAVHGAVARALRPRSRPQHGRGGRLHRIEGAQPALLRRPEQRAVRRPATASSGSSRARRCATRAGAASGRASTRRGRSTTALRSASTSATRADWQGQASYTYGNSHDTWSGGQIGGSDFDNGAGSATDWWDPEYEYGPSSYDIRHTLVVNAVYLLPFGQGTTGFRGAILQGWQIGGVAQFSSGLPFTPFESTIRLATGRATPVCRSRTSTVK